ncbi:MAG: 1,4-dihydroxy-2-naphthoate octaprenyltransferase [Planctomycetota bacterium]
MNLAFWIAATRPKTLLAGVVPVALGVALAAPTTPISWPHAIGCLLAAILIQVATNFANDAIDARKGADTPDRLGPTRAVASGQISERAMLAATLALLAMALAIGIWLSLRGGWPILALGVISLACAWGYTGGPLPLAYHGLGDVFVWLFFGLVATVGTAWIQIAPMDVAIPEGWWLAGSAVGLHATVILAVNNWRDRHSDAEASKRTLAVRLSGRAYSRYLAALLLGATVCYWLIALTWAALLAAVGGLLIYRGLFRTEGRALNAYLGRSAGLEAACATLAILELIGVL